MSDEWKARPERPGKVPFLHLRLDEQLDRLRQEPTWRASGRNAVTLVKEPAPPGGPDAARKGDEDL
jgi:hypothetical protein